MIRNRGIKSFLAGLTQMGRAIMTREPFIIAPKTHFFSRPEAFIKKAETCGLIYQQSFRHKEITEKGELMENADRYDYIFRTAGTSPIDRHTAL